MKVKFKQYLYRPFRLLWFEADELFIGFGCLLLGMYLHYLFLLIGPGILFVSRKVKSKYPRGFLKHLSYFLGVFRFKKYPSFFETYFKD